MDKDTAVIHLLTNFAYIDYHIAQEEVEVIKKYASKKGINVDIDSIIEFAEKNANDEELKFYADSINFLNQNLTEDEKIELLKAADELIKSDGAVLKGEEVKLEMLSKNWGIDLKKIK